jgi:hypothetical protein
MMRSYSTHHQSYGASSAPSIYKALRRLADGYPDSKTGANTAISSVLSAQFTQVYIVASSKAQLASLPPRHAEPYAGPPFPRPAAEEVPEGVQKVAAAARGAAATH